MELNPLIHQPVRLRIMAVLTGLAEDEQAEFGMLQKSLGLTGGNLGAHLGKLEEGRYVEVEKTFVGRRPRTYLRATAAGRAAFAAHVEALRALLGD